MLNVLENIVRVSVPAAEKEAKLSPELESLKAKADKCRDLARVGTKADIESLAAMLADEKLSHMARYSLETIPDPAVDDVLRDALGKLKGKLLAGVIGSLGVRRDTKAVEALVKLLKDEDAVVAQAAARALGRMGTAYVAEALCDALKTVSDKNCLAFCEGLFRCAESLAAQGLKTNAIAAYDCLRALKAAPQQVRAGALRGAVLCRCKKEGLPLLMEAIRGDDWILFAAAARTVQELYDDNTNKAVADELGKLSADKQAVLKQAIK